VGRTPSDVHVAPHLAHSRSSALLAGAEDHEGAPEIRPLQLRPPERARPTQGARLAERHGRRGVLYVYSILLRRFQFQRFHFTFGFQSSLQYHRRTFRVVLCTWQVTGVKVSAVYCTSKQSDFCKRCAFQPSSGYDSVSLPCRTTMHCTLRGLIKDHVDCAFFPRIVVGCGIALLSSHR